MSAPAASPRSHGAARRERLWAAALAAAVLLTYARGLRDGLVWDDVLHIVDNPQVHSVGAAAEYLFRPPRSSKVPPSAPQTTQRSGPASVWPAYRRADLAPGNAQIFENLGTLCLAGGDIDAARSAFTTAIELDAAVADLAPRTRGHRADCSAALTASMRNGGKARVRAPSRPASRSRRIRAFAPAARTAATA